MLKLTTHLLLLTLIINVTCFNQCSVIQFPDYSFDLTNLRNFTIIQGGTYTQITPCYLKTCDQTPNSQNTFFFKTVDNICQPYSSTQSNI